MTKYQEFLSNKRRVTMASGFSVSRDEINPMLFDFQSDIVRWALRRGKAAIFADCGMGKTPMQLEWARQVHIETGKPVLILAPLAVATQTSSEGEKFGVSVTVCESQTDMQDGLNITNYQKLHKFSPDDLGGIVLDESSILKGSNGKYRKELTDFADSIPYRLCCTATPAPNDLDELTRHAEFLGIMREKEIKALYFTQDGNSTTKWRLKGHAINAFWEWMAQWSVAIRQPSDLGYEDGNFVLPALNMHDVMVRQRGATAGMLFAVEAQTMSERRQARKDTIQDRCEAAARLVNESDEEWLVWCALNTEGDLLEKLIPDAVHVAGKHKDEQKQDRMLGFSDGSHRVLISKPSMCGFGMNWQHCRNVIFVGLSDSYEQFYQAIRRCWRFGQKREVNCYVVTADTEGAVVANIKRKEKQSIQMFDQIVRKMAVNSELNTQSGRNEMEYKTDVAHGDDWTLYLGDSVETIDNVEDESIGLTVFSPPFPGMYVYTNSVHDMGNVESNVEMIEQFRFLMKKVLKKTIKGRTCAIHLTQGTAQKMRDGYVGIKDFRGQVIKMMEDVGWIYYGEVCIDKNPQVKAIRTRDSGLQFKSLATDSARMHMALADYMLQFRKRGENPVPIRAGISTKYSNENGWITQEEWIKWARPIWYGSDYAPAGCEVHDGIRETDVLNVKQARETNDERHLCPLQLGVIERAVKLWSAPNDIVYSPFAGVGSEGVKAIELGRRFIGGELKESYWKSACENLEDAVRETGVKSLFDFALSG